MNRQTREKIAELKSMIANKKELKEILKLKFSNSRPRLIKWLDENNTSFTTKELEYLEYVKEVEEVDTIAITTVPQGGGIDSILGAEMANLKLLASEDMFKFLFNLYQENKAQPGPIKSDKNLKFENIDTEYLTMNDVVIKNCRISDGIYKKFSELCKAKNYTITSVLNYLLDTFYKENL